MYVYNMLFLIVVIHSRDCCSTKKCITKHGKLRSFKKINIMLIDADISHLLMSGSPNLALVETTDVTIF